MEESKMKKQSAKKKTLLAMCGLLFLGTCACQGGGKSKAQSYWKEAAKQKEFNAYVAEHASDIEMETLKKEADAAGSDLKQQFQATALLCGVEYQNGLLSGKVKKGGESASEAARAAYEFDYPDSAAYAEKFLAKAADAGEDFWDALDTSFYPYDCFTPVFAAAGHIDGDAAAALYNGAPEDCGYKDKLSSALEQWVEENPQELCSVGDALWQCGFYKEWDTGKWNRTYFYSYSKNDPVQTDTLQEAADYISCLRTQMLPKLKKEFGKKEYQQAGEYTGKPYYDTKLAVAVEEGLKLAKPKKVSGQADGSGKAIKIEGKKVAAFYCNNSAKKWEGSPAKLRMLGDFMLGLPKKEYPSSIKKADYYLVLTPAYKRGQFYTDQSGKKTKVREVYSSTSIDLYEAKSGKFLRHLGNVTEQPNNTIFDDLTAEKFQYPEIMSADVLSYIYHHINEPDSYLTLLDNTANTGTQLNHGESVVMGNWEIAYKSAQIVKSFDEGMFRFTAKDGHQYIRAEVAITNRGRETDTFLPNVYRIGEDPIVQITDEAGTHTYNSVNAIQDSRCLNSTSLDAGGTKEGELIFEVPDNVLQDVEKLYVAVSLGNQRVTYRLR